VPTYEYRCTECDHTFEAVQAFTEDSIEVCPSCGGRVRKLFGNVGIVFKGSGFYKTDSRAKKTAVSSGGSAESGGSAGDGASSNGSDGDKKSGADGDKKSSGDKVAASSNGSGGSNGSSKSESGSSGSSDKPAAAASSSTLGQSGK
jgi:putative FmdB family regulatory protein